MAQVEIVMALYNKGATVERAIRSIRQQSLSDWRLIVVDDGSTDEGPARAAALGDARIELVRQENRGPGAARNAGLARAASPLVSFLDADDEWYPWFLEEAAGALGNERVGMAVTPFYYWPSGQDIRATWARQGIFPGEYLVGEDADPAWVNRLRKAPWVGNVVLRTELARRCGGFYEKDRCVVGEDSTFFFRVVFNAVFAILERPAARYHLESSVLGYYSGRGVQAPPYLQDPSTVLEYCDAARRGLMERVLDHEALMVAHLWARAGRKAEATALLAARPGVRAYGTAYWRCRYELLVSRWLPRWVRFKCAVGPPVRRWLRRRLACRSAAEAPPAMPDEQPAPTAGHKDS